ncbi:hypothetical protein COHA_005484 [Chlorella ohadii]|uniref:Uncharacterized protein n=1 Tax=Chlorella ohadii TaxID=2649997 RepID=A0AAD5DQS7_9CHLO|nr:hypothetical protein COHA_005484 [Chlorella ohadii]
MPAPVHVLLAVLAVGALKNAQAAPALVVPCEGLTGVDYCTECAKPAGAAKPFCYLCHPTRASIWRKDGTISECKAATTGVACTSATGDQNCAYCYGVTCMQCKPGYEADSNFKCMTIDQMKAFALTITGNPAVVPTGCKEVDTEFKCIRCANTHSLTGGTCKTLATGSKCKTSLTYYQYCAQCDTAGTKCLSCNGSRSPPTGVTDGRCALPCKQLFGIGCLKCNQSKCLNTDAKYAQGRK